MMRKDTLGAQAAPHNSVTTTWTPPDFGIQTFQTLDTDYAWTKINHQHILTSILI